MILEVLADVRRVELALHANGFELALGTDAGQQKDLRRTHGTGTEDHLPPSQRQQCLAVRRPVLDPPRGELTTAGLQNHAGHLGVSYQLEVRSLRHATFEEGVEGARTPTIAGGGLQQRHHTGVTAAVLTVVVTTRDPHRDRRLDELLRTADDR